MKKFPHKIQHYTYFMKIKRVPSVKMMSRRMLCIGIFLHVSIDLCNTQRIEGRYMRPPAQKERPCSSSSSSGKCGGESDIPKDPYDFVEDYKVSGNSDESRSTISGYRYKPDSDIRDGYQPKPVRDDYAPKPNNRGYYPESEIKDEYGLNPTEREDYDSKSSTRGEYGSRPADGDARKPKLPGQGDSGSRPFIRDDYDPRPIVKNEYAQKTPITDGYPARPIYKDDNQPKPAPENGGPYGQPGDRDKQRRPSHKDGYKVGDMEDFNNDKDDWKEPEPPVKSISLDAGNCICVPYYQCKEGHIVTDGSGIIDARRRPASEEDLPLDGKFNPPSCGPFHVCCNTPESSTVKPYEHNCGVRHPNGINSRILSPSNKGEADFGEWPWQAAVLKTEGTVNIFQCGGVIIDKYHVLTVAHCVFHLYKYDEYPLKVRLGEWDTQTTKEFLAHEDYNVSKIIIHPEYRNTSLWNDIAILRLRNPVQFAPHIDTVCLPRYDENFAGQNCVVTGWGKDSYKGGTFSNVMKEVALQVIDDYRCEEMLRKTRLGRFFQLHEGFICAGGEHGLDSCKGDGGGPLVCYRKDRSYALAGLVSWGIDCGQPGVPGVYVKIQKFLDWISKNTGVSLQEYWPKV